jgi:tetratricopeptide (TPR) repeat protein
MKEEMEENLRLALKYDPNYTWAVHMMGGLYYSKGEFATAFEYLIKTAKMTGQLDPASSRYNLFLAEWNTLHIFRCLFDLGFYEDAKRIAGEWLKLSYDDQWGYNYNVIWGAVINCRFEEAYRIGLDNISQKHFNFLLALLFMRKNTELMKYVKEAVDLNKKEGKEPAEMAHYAGYTFLVNGQSEEAEKYFNTAVSYVDTLLTSHPGNKFPVTYYSLMNYLGNPIVILTCVAAMRGENEKALAYLREIRKNYLTSGLEVVTILKLYPMFDNIRNEPEFQDYLREAENHYLSERKKVEKLLKEEGIIK